MLSQKQAMTIRMATTTLDPQYPNVERDVTANGVWTVAPTMALAMSSATPCNLDRHQTSFPFYLGARDEERDSDNWVDDASHTRNSYGCQETANKDRQA